MGNPLRILIVEDQPNDVELAIREVKKVIETSEFFHVDTQAAFLNAVTHFQPDLIISDYDMPSFDGLTVVKLTLQHSPLTPVIIFTGAIDEETAAESVKAGAVDYVIKGNYIRLKQAVLQALEKKKMWQERIIADERIRASEERYRLISSVTSDYMFSTLTKPGSGANPEWVAGAFEKITGYTFEEYKAIGGWRAIVHPDDIEIDDNDLKKLQSNQVVISEIRNIKKNGEILWVTVYAHPVWDDKNNCLAGIYGAVQDITKRKKAEEELLNINKHLNKLVKERTKELEVLNKTKDKFFSIIAHDLKNPFAVIISSSEMLLRTIADHPEDVERMKRYSENILRGTQDGYKLLENLLEWATSQTGAIKFEPQTIDLSERVLECITGMKLNLGNKDIKIIYPKTPYLVYADKNMVDVILRNLVSNAVKYSQPGGTITIKMTDQKDRIYTEIIDTGVGMSELAQSMLFHLETKSSTSGTLKEHGTGLGLILCKEFIDKLGGTISVSSAEGKGSVFSFTIPTGPITKK